MVRAALVLITHDVLSRGWHVVSVRTTRPVRVSGPQYVLRHVFGTFVVLVDMRPPREDS